MMQKSTENRFEVLAEITKFKLNADIVSFFLHCNFDRITIYFEYTTKTVLTGVCTQKSFLLLVGIDPIKGNQSLFQFNI